VRLATRLTRPLKQIANAASSVQEADLSVRIPAVSEDAELQDVTAGLNAMLARLEAGFDLQQQMLESQRRFTADASHELRTPLTNLQGHLEVALRRPRPAEEYRQTLAVALSETQRMARLVADLLTLSRADANTLALKLRACNLAELAAQAASAFYSKAEAAGVNLCLDSPDKLSVVADPDKLRQVVDNLLDNAVRHAPRGSQVSLKLSEQSGEAHLSVVDAGPGLTPDEQAQVFERFYRTDPSRTSASGGTGLGLSIAKAIVEAHGGRIEVRSQPGILTAFAIVLKREDAPRDLH
jgi:two-component system, OmpR family, sensor kinase